MRKAPGVITRTLAEPGRQYAIYIDGIQGRGECKISIALPEGDYRLEWVNTKTETVEKKEQISAKGDVTVISSPRYEPLEIKSRPIFRLKIKFLAQIYPDRM